MFGRVWTFSFFKTTGPVRLGTELEAGCGTLDVGFPLNRVGLLLLGGTLAALGALKKL
jgi:hypothetical protein